MKQALAVLLMLSLAGAVSADISSYLSGGRAHFIIDARNPSAGTAQVSATAGSDVTGTQSQSITLAPYEQRRMVFDFDVTSPATFEVSVKSGNEPIAYKAVSFSPERAAQEEGIDPISFFAMVALLLVALVFLVPFLAKGKLPFGIRKVEFQRRL